MKIARAALFLLATAFSALALLATGCGQTPDIPPDVTPTPTRVRQATPTATPEPLAPVIMYKIQPGDTLTAIAQKHGVAVADIMEFNSIPNANNLTIGDELIIPSLEFRAQLTPLPTAEPVENPPYRMAASMAKDYPPRKGKAIVHGTITRYGVGVAGATMYIVVHYPDGDQRIEGDRPSDMGGTASATFTVRDVQVSEPIKVDVFMRHGDQTYQAQTQFRPI